MEDSINLIEMGIISGCLGLVFWLVRRDVIRGVENFSDKLIMAISVTNEKVDKVEKTVDKQGEDIKRIDKAVVKIEANPVLKNGS